MSEQNLLPRDQGIIPQQFLSAFFSEEETVNLRVFYDPEKGRPGMTFSVKLNEFGSVTEVLKKHNMNKYGIFFVVNSGGNSDKDINKINAQFFECDTGTFKEQWDRIRDFPLQPSIVVQTRKSLHVYYLTKNAEVEKFRDIQKRLVQKFKGDPVCINESRVLRIPGYFHQKQDPFLVRCVVFNPDIKYTQAELDRVLPALETKVPEKAVSETKLIKDTPGLKILKQKCKFIHHCELNAASLSEYDWYAMITNLAAFKGGREEIHKLSREYPKYSKIETDNKIEHFLTSDTSPIWCSTISEKGWKCPLLGKCGCNSPAGLAFQRMKISDLSKYLDDIPDTEDVTANYLTAKEFVEEYMINVPFDEATLFIENRMKEKFKYKAAQTKELVKILRAKISVAKKEGTTAFDYTQTLKGLIFEIRSLYNDKETQLDALAKHIYKWLEENGGMFYRFTEGGCVLHYKGHNYPLEQVPETTSFFYLNTGIMSSSTDGRLIIQAMSDIAYIYAHKVQKSKWMHYSEEKEAIYLNLCSDNNIIKLASNDLQIIPNGINADGVILEKTINEFIPIEYDEDAEIKYGLLLFKENFMDILTCDPLNAIFIASWFMSIFLKDLSVVKPIMKFSGNSTAGKSTAAKIITELLYGKTSLSVPTAAALYSMAARDPLLVCDNLESEDMTKDIQNFLLGNATGTARQKREMGTSSGIVTETVDAFVIITSIEPLTASEAINRTYDIAFADKYKQKGFLERKRLTEIRKNRNTILSAIFKLIAYYVLPKIDMYREEAMEILEMQPHSKNRTNEMLSIMMSVLLAIKDIAPELLLNMTIPEIVKGWLTYHDVQSDVTENDTDPVIFFLEMFLREVIKENCIDLSTSYDVELIREHGKIKGFAGTMKDIYSAFSVMAKQKGYKFYFKSPRQLNTRLNNIESLVKRTGWHIDKDSNNESGLKVWTFFKQSVYFSDEQVDDMQKGVS